MAGLRWLKEAKPLRPVQLRLTEDLFRKLSSSEWSWLSSIRFMADSRLEITIRGRSQGFGMNLGVNLGSEWQEF